MNWTVTVALSGVSFGWLMQSPLLIPCVPFRTLAMTAHVDILWQNPIEIGRSDLFKKWLEAPYAHDEVKMSDDDEQHGRQIAPQVWPCMTIVRPLITRQRAL